jgi:hypothetical protein
MRTVLSFFVTLSLSVVLSLLAPQAAIATLINFDDYSFVTNWSQAAADRYRSLGIVFDRVIPISNVWRLEGQSRYDGFLRVGGTSPNALCLSAATWGYTIEASFVVPGTTTPATTGLVRILAYDTEVGSTLGSLTAYDRNNDLIDMDSRVTPSSCAATLEISSPGIAHVHLNTDTDGADFDNLFFNAPAGPVAVEPTSWGRIKALLK